MAGFAKQLREELLEVMIHAHTEERDQTSVFHRRTSLKPVQRDYRVYIQERESYYESAVAALRVRRSQWEPGVSDESL